MEEHIIKECYANLKKLAQDNGAPEAPCAFSA
jgi:hypothetical protein